MSSIDKLFPYAGVEARLGYTFRNKELLFCAFTHRSYLNEHKDALLQHNERLEYLGDAVLSLIVTEYLYHKFPEATEGVLSTLRSQLIDATACQEGIKILGCEAYLLLGRGEERNQAGRASILADLFEAILGALFLDAGLETVKKFLFTHFQGFFDTLVSQPVVNFKAALQDLAQKKYNLQPRYLVEKEEGPEHQKSFQVAVYLGEEKWGMGQGKSKKIAEQEAAKEALAHYNENAH